MRDKARTRDSNRISRYAAKYRQTFSNVGISQITTAINIGAYYLFKYQWEGRIY